MSGFVGRTREEVLSNLGFKPYSITKPFPWTTLPKRKWAGWFEAADIANQKGKEQGAEEEWMGKGDAMRHLVWQALLAKKYGPKFAKWAGDWHEDSGNASVVGGPETGQSRSEMEQDLYNNKLGLEIAQKANSMEEVFSLAQEMIDSGRAKFKWIKPDSGKKQSSSR